jgi:hypothetical protein
MRHLIGFVLALGTAAAIFFGASWGYLRILRVPVAGAAASTLPGGGGSLWHDRSVLLAFAALAGVGLLAGLLVAIKQISPLAAGLPGLVLIAWSVFYLANVHRAVQYIPLKSHSFGTGFEALLLNGILAVAGLALVIPLFIPSRWYRSEPLDVEPGRLAPATPTGASSVLLQQDWGSETAPITTTRSDQPPPAF